MAKKNKPKFDFAKLLEDLQRQFQNLDPKDPSLWPVLPRALLCVLIAAGVATFLWFFKLTDYEQELTAERSTEQTLREDYQKKLVKAVSLDALKKQREQIQQYVIQLEKQLPSKAEMSARPCTRLRGAWGWNSVTSSIPGTRLVLIFRSTSNTWRRTTPLKSPSATSKSCATARALLKRPLNLRARTSC